MAPKTIDEYIAGFSPEIQAILQKVRVTVHRAAPDAKEKISYRIPSFTLDGSLVYFAAFKNHIGFYPPATGDAKLMKEISTYAGEKGNLRFPLDKPIPYALISKVVKARVKENRERVSMKRSKGSGLHPVLLARGAAQPGAELGRVCQAWRGTG